MILRAPVIAPRAVVRPAAMAARFLARKLERRKNRGRPFREFIGKAMPRFHWIKAREVIVVVLQALYDGELSDQEGRRYDRLQIWAPAQLGKSTIVQLFSSWLLDWALPEAALGVVCHGRLLATRFSRLARFFYKAAGGVLGESEAVHQWEVEGGGEFWCRGLREATSGNPLWAAIVDDIDKDAAHAVSPPQQEFVRQVWYGPTLRNRRSGEAPRFLEVAIGTPHAVGDSQDYMLSVRAADSPEVAPGWYVLALPAIYDPENYPIKLPEGCTLHPDWRRPGESVAPELAKFSPEALETERTGGGYTPARWSALMQMCRVPDEGGGILRRVWFWLLDEDPAGGDPDFWRSLVRAWDFAATEGRGDGTAGIKLAERRDTHRWVLRHCAWGQKESSGVKRLVVAVALFDHVVDGPGRVTVRIPQDPATAKGVAGEVERYLREVFRWLDLVAPPVVTRPVSKLNKAERVKAPGGPAGHAAPPRPHEPVGEGNRGKYEVLCEAPRMRLRDVVEALGPLCDELARQPGDGDAAAKLQELQAIEELFDAVFGGNAERAKKLNVRTGDWWTPLLDELHDFTGRDGKRDDRTDALAEATSQMGRGTFKPRIL